jgi:DNA-binding winged helix-turn-helix (wHTH) protein
LRGFRSPGAQGTTVKLGGRAFDALVALVERRDSTVGKDELMDLVWPKLVVEENNLQVQIVAPRKLLGHPAIATVLGVATDLHCLSK